jgi:hypothetical protein
MNDLRIRNLLVGLLLAQGGVLVFLNAMTYPSTLQVLRPMHGGLAYVTAATFVLMSLAGVLMGLLSAHTGKPIWQSAAAILFASVVSGYMEHRAEGAPLTVIVVLAVGALLHIAVVYGYRNSCTV